jgi:hypothetical protein
MFDYPGALSGAGASTGACKCRDGGDKSVLSAGKSVAQTQHTHRRVSGERARAREFSSKYNEQLLRLNRLIKLGILAASRHRSRDIPPAFIYNRHKEGRGGVAKEGFIEISCLADRFSRIRTAGW